jgi:hypothetical protein
LLLLLLLGVVGTFWLILGACRCTSECQSGSEYCIIEAMADTS